MLKLRLLTDNLAGRNTLAEHGFSLLVEHEGLKILFDTGQTDVFLTNGERTGAHLNSLDYIILSHGHFDHGGGLRFLKGGKLIAHPDCFIKRFRIGSEENIGLYESREQLSGRFDLMLAREPLFLTENIAFLGEIPRLKGIPLPASVFIKENGERDDVKDDSALAIRLKEGLAILTGCGHSGIVNIVQYAAKVMNDNRIEMILGGFHLKTDNTETRLTVKMLKDFGVREVYPVHCTEWPALCAFKSEYTIRRLCSGDIVTKNAE